MSSIFTDEPEEMGGTSIQQSIYDVHYNSYIFFNYFLQINKITIDRKQINQQIHL